MICVGAGAGGHASIQSGFSLVREIRAFWDGCLILGGAINDGWQVRAAETLGADLAYVGTRFVASEESGASSDYKTMLLESEVSDLVYTDRMSGIGCNFLRPSLERWGVDLDTSAAQAARFDQPSGHRGETLARYLDGGARCWRHPQHPLRRGNRRRHERGLSRRLRASAFALPFRRTLGNARMRAPIVLWFDFASPYAHSRHGRRRTPRRRARTRDRMATDPSLGGAEGAIHPRAYGPAREARLLPCGRRALRRVSWGSLSRAQQVSFVLACSGAALLCGRRRGSKSGPRSGTRFVFGVLRRKHRHFRGDRGADDECGSSRHDDRSGAGRTRRRRLAGRRLSEAIEGAVASGVCGSPWFLVDGEAFFGADRLAQIAWRLSGAAPASPA